MSRLEQHLHKNSISMALSFAKSAHKGAFRKYSGKPYIVHPISVANILLQYYPDSSDVDIIAALIHDVIEDTEYTYDDIKLRFGHEVASIAGWLTNASIDCGASRYICKSIDRAHLSLAPVKPQIIKVADIFDNTSDVDDMDEGSALIFLPERILMLEVMSDEVKRLPIYKDTINNIRNSIKNIENLTVTA